MSYTNVTDAINRVSNIEAKLAPLDNVAFDLIATHGVWGGGGVAAFDDSSAGQVTHYNQAGSSNDLHIAGLFYKGTRQYNKGYIIYGETPLTGKVVSILRHGQANVRIADDNDTIAVGDVLQAEADSQTIEGVASQAVGVVDKMAWEELTITTPTSTDITNWAADLSAQVGISLEAEASSVDDDDERIACYLEIVPYIGITEATE